ncbi:hypothetical protein KY348_07815 [Candidatus Woesearchaeota archaeon]|nr:hypothetical protein [Candidatus Woesearchaeota archaeon]
MKKALVLMLLMIVFLVGSVSAITETFYGLTSDGQIRSQDDDYSNALTGTGSYFSAIGEGTDYHVHYLGQLYQSDPQRPYMPRYVIDKFYIAFDTSSIPDHALITEATLSVVGQNDASETDFYIEIYEGTWSPTLTTDDWYAYTDFLGNLVHTSNYLIDEYMSLSVPADSVNIFGKTDYVLRSSREADGIAPTPTSVYFGRETVGLWPAGGCVPWKSPCDPMYGPNYNAPKLKVTYCIDDDGDGYCAPEDCDDTNPSVHPGAPEVCNGLDDDCDGEVDEDYRTPLITNCCELQLMKDDLAGDYVLVNDIDCSDTVNWNSGEGFEPIGNSTNQFTGTFDGQDYTITGLYISRGGENHVGLFGYVAAGATISNVGMVDVNMVGLSHVGGLIGLNSGTVSNSYASGTVSGSNCCIGGLVGSNTNGGTISRCYATSSVTGTGDHGELVGGLVGYNTHATITDSYATGHVRSRNENVGGLVGRNWHGGQVINSYSSGSLDYGPLPGGRTPYFRAGGLVGYNFGDGSLIENCFTTATMQAGAPSPYGGAFNAQNYGSIINSYYNNYTGNPYPGVAYIGYSAVITDVTAIQDNEGYFYECCNAPMDTWDFFTSPIWGKKIADPDNYPCLYWEDGCGQAEPCCTDADEDGYFAIDPACPEGDDCDDTNPTIHPGAPEICDGRDNDCDPGTPDGADETWFGQPCDGPDLDFCEEGVFECIGGVMGCTDLTPDNEEVCNGIDDDCDGEVDEDAWCDDGIECTLNRCIDGGCIYIPDQSRCDDGNVCTDDVCDLDIGCFYLNNANSCDDGLWCNGEDVCSDGSCVAGTPIICDDGIECTYDICNEERDMCEYPNKPLGEECGESRDCPADACDWVYAEFYPDDGHDTCDGDGVCVAHSCTMEASYCSDDNSGDGVNRITCGAECDQHADCYYTPCDGFDGCYDNIYRDYHNVANNCLFEADCRCERNECTDYTPEPDNDGDGFSVSCGDCDDSSGETYPGADDSSCDGVDNDCDGVADEDYVPASTECGIGACASTGTLTCVDGVEVDTCTPGAPGADDATCDAVDDDCDGVADEDYVSLVTECGVGECAAVGSTSCVGGVVFDSCTPGTAATEVCDGLDNDCDGTADEGFDSDGDGVADCFDGCPYDPNKVEPGVCDCGVPDGDTDGDGVADCLDGCPDDPNKVDVGVCGCGVPDLDNDGDGSYSCDDCDDTDPNNYPGNTEVCDGKDNDCFAGDDYGNIGVPGSELDEDLDGFLTCMIDYLDTASSCTTDDTDSDGDGLMDCLDLCLDVDGDNYGVDNSYNIIGDGSIPVGDCTSDGITPCVFYDDACISNDCDDSDPDVHPDNTEVCDGKDNDCDGLIDEGFDTDGDGIADCFDNCPSIANPGQEDSDGDGTGNACDCEADGYCTAEAYCEGQSTPDPDCCTDQDGDGYLGTPYGCGPDCNDADASVFPGADDSGCDGVDNDCDGTADEDYVSDETCFLPGVCASGNAGSTCVEGVETPCATGSPAGADDDCNGIDEDCDGTPDEHYVPTPTTCGIGECASTGELICTGGVLSDTCTEGTPADEICDVLDND